MKMSKLAGRRLKELPKDAKTVSHQFLIRGGYIRPVSAGIYSLLPMGKRITDKIEKIIREEMDRIDGQEILMPVVLPAELWQESGRYEAVGADLNEDITITWTWPSQLNNSADTYMSSLSNIATYSLSAQAVATQIV